MEAGSNLSKDHSHTRPADILVPNWSLGKPAAFDLSVTSPLNVLLEAGLAAGQAARATEQRKNDAKCKELGWVCIPMVVRHMVLGGQRQWSLFHFWPLALQLAPNRAKAEVLAALYGG